MNKKNAFSVEAQLSRKMATRTGNKFTNVTLVVDNSKAETEEVPK